MNLTRTTALMISFTFCAAIMWGFIKTAHASDLWDIYELALSNEPGFQAAILENDASQIDLPLAQSAFRPVFSANAQAAQLKSDVSGSSNTRDNNEANLLFDLPLYDRPNRIGISQTEILVDISSLQLQEDKQRLILLVADRYFNLLAGQDAREVARVDKIAIKRQMDLASERLDVGLGTRTDLFDARARYKLAVADEIRAQNKINNDIALLKQLIGTTPEAIVELSDSAPLERPVPDDVDQWIDKSIDHNIPLKIQKLSLEVSLQEIDRQKTARRPTLSLFGAHRWNDSGSTSIDPSGDNIFSDSNATTVGIGLNFPIYLGGTINLRTRQAGILYNQAGQLLEEARRQAATETTSAYLAVTSGISQVEALYDAITAGESALEAKEEGFNAGLTTNLDVLDAQRDLSSSRTDYLRAKYTYILAVLELERAVGQLDEEDVRRVTSWLKDS